MARTVASRGDHARASGSYANDWADRKQALMAIGWISWFYVMPTRDTIAKA
jgi:hypothetical protein